MRLVFSNLYLILSLACTAYYAFAAPVTDDKDKSELIALERAGKINELQQQLQKLQGQLDTLKVVSPQEPKELDNAKPRSGATNAKLETAVEIPTADSRDGNSLAGFLQRPHVKVNKEIFYDQPIPKRAIGFQPVRSVDDQPADLKLRLEDKEDIRQQILDAVVGHLLQDLEAAEAYGVKTQEILQYLRQKQKP